MQSTFEKAGETFPMMKKISTFYTPRSKNITVWSLGLRTGGVELVLAEQIGCKVQIFDPRPQSSQTFQKIQTLLKDHSYTPYDPAWCESVSKSTVNIDRLSFSTDVPFTFGGFCDISGIQIRLKPINLEEVPRVDFCKIDFPDLETNLVYSVLNAGYRPGLFLIRWNHKPDEFTETMLAAGHLQNSGYKLVAVENGYFLYLFYDECLYEICSWQRTDVNNPKYEEMKKGFLNFFTVPKAEESSK
jgi:hypothetical protein